MNYNEIDADAKLTTTEKVCIGLFALWPLLFVLAVLALIGGCKAFYENSGADIDVGDTTVPLKLKEPTSSFDLEFLFTLTGAKVWTAKDSNVKVNYRNTYTNYYLFGLVDKKGVQDFEVEVLPVSVNGTDCEACTNCADTASANQINQ